jgi:hypothetical protein
MDEFGNIRRNSAEEVKLEELEFTCPPDKIKGDQHVDYACFKSKPLDIPCNGSDSDDDFNPFGYPQKKREKTKNHNGEHG